MYELLNKHAAVVVSLVGLVLEQSTSSDIKQITSTFFDTVDLMTNIHELILLRKSIRALQSKIMRRIKNEYYDLNGSRQLFWMFCGTKNDLTKEHVLPKWTFPKGWAGEVSGVYTTRNRDEGQALSLPIGQVSAGISKSLLNNKASLKFNIRDIFYTNTFREIQNFEDVQSTITRARDIRVFNNAFVYRFGVQSKPKTSQTTDEQKRIQTN